jgi:ABC-type transport system involved in cytochrome bd biosynthesis fused ATPase/permease subunit
MELSYGGMAKVALARAYMKDAQVLIFDCPTAALDEEQNMKSTFCRTYSKATCSL